MPEQTYFSESKDNLLRSKGVDPAIAYSKLQELSKFKNPSLSANPLVETEVQVGNDYVYNDTNSFTEQFLNSYINQVYLTTPKGFTNLIPTVGLAIAGDNTKAADFFDKWIEGSTKFFDSGKQKVTATDRFIDNPSLLGFASGLGQGVGFVATSLLGGVLGKAANYGKFGQYAIGTAINTPVMQTMYYEEALNNGLSKKDAAKFSSALAPISALSEYFGFEMMGNAITKPILSQIRKKAMLEGVKEFAAKGATQEGFHSAASLMSKAYAESFKDVLKNIGTRGVQAGFAEGSQEFGQSYMEEGAKQIYDTYFAKDAEAKFGADVRTHFKDAANEAFFGGVIGVAIGSGGGAMYNPIFEESLFNIIDKAKDKEKIAAKIKKDIAKQTSLKKLSLEEAEHGNNLIDKIVTFTSQDLPQTVTNPIARFQALRLNDIKTDLEGKIKGNPILIPDYIPQQIAEIEKVMKQIGNSDAPIPNFNEVLVKLNEIEQETKTKYQEDEEVQEEEIENVEENDVLNTPVQEQGEGKTEEVVAPPVPVIKEERTKEVIESDIARYENTIKNTDKEIEKLRKSKLRKDETQELRDAKIANLEAKKELLENKINEFSAEIGSQEAGIEEAENIGEAVEARDTRVSGEVESVGANITEEDVFTEKGGNKVVDENGSPLTLYRSTYSDNDFSDGVTYFAEDESYSKEIASIMNADGKSSDYIETKQVRTIPVNISAKRVYELPSGTEMNDNVIKGLMEKDPLFTEKYDAVKGIDLYSDNKIVYAVFNKENIRKTETQQPKTDTTEEAENIGEAVEAGDTGVSGEVEQIERENKDIVFAQFGDNINEGFTTLADAIKAQLGMESGGKDRISGVNIWTDSEGVIKYVGNEAERSNGLVQNTFAFDWDGNLIENESIINDAGVLELVKKYLPPSKESQKSEAEEAEEQPKKRQQKPESAEVQRLRQDVEDLNRNLRNAKSRAEAGRIRKQISQKNKMIAAVKKGIPFMEKPKLKRVGTVGVPNFIRNFEPSSPRDKVLNYFVSGGRVSRQSIEDSLGLFKTELVDGVRKVIKGKEEFKALRPMFSEKAPHYTDVANEMSDYEGGAAYDEMLSIFESVMGQGKKAAIEELRENIEKMENAGQRTMTDEELNNAYWDALADEQAEYEAFTEAEVIALSENPEIEEAVEITLDNLTQPQRAKLEALVNKYTVDGVTDYESILTQAKEVFGSDEDILALDAELNYNLEKILKQYEAERNEQQTKGIANKKAVIGENESDLDQKIEGAREKLASAEQELADRERIINKKVKEAAEDLFKGGVEKKGDLFGMEVDYSPENVDKMLEPYRGKVETAKRNLEVLEQPINREQARDIDRRQREIKFEQDVINNMIVVGEIDIENKMDKETYENLDTRGKYFAIIKDGNLMTSGSNPSKADKPIPIKNLLNLAKTYNGKLYISDNPIASFDYKSGDILGYTFEQIKAKQQGQSFDNSYTIKINEGVDKVEIKQYEDYSKVVNKAEDIVDNMEENGDIKIECE